MKRFVFLHLLLAIVLLSPSCQKKIDEPLEEDTHIETEPEIPEEIGDISLSFSTRIMNSYELPREVDVLVSTDFNGDYTHSHVSAATWTDISDRFVFSSPENGQAPTTLTPSGKANISDLLVAGQSFYVAFRYTSTGVPPASRFSRGWRVEDFSLIHEHDEGATILANQQTAGWSMVSKGGVAPGRGGSIQAVRLNFLANNTEGVEIGLEEWGITKAIVVNLNVHTATYYVDPDNGDDGNDGNDLISLENTDSG